MFKMRNMIFFWVGHFEWTIVRKKESRNIQKNAYHREKKNICFAVIAAFLTRMMNETNMKAKERKEISTKTDVNVWCGTINCQNSDSKFKIKQIARITVCWECVCLCVMFMPMFFLLHLVCGTIDMYGDHVLCQTWRRHQQQ